MLDETLLSKLPIPLLIAYVSLDYQRMSHKRRVMLLGWSDFNTFLKLKHFYLLIAKKQPKTKKNLIKC